MKKVISLLLCLSLLLGAVALAETTDATDVAAPAASTAAELQDTDVIVTINSQPVTWAELKSVYDSLVASYGSYYDMADGANVDLFRAVAVENKISETVMAQKAVELKVELTAEEAATAEANADTDWNSAIQNYIAGNYPDLTDESAQADKDAANAAAVKYYNDLGFTTDSLHTDYKKYAVYDKVEAMMTQDAAVTDEEVEAMYQSLVEADKEKYQSDISAYLEYNNYVDQMDMYAMYYGNANSMDHAWYRPAGFRAVKHILLPVDEALMATYQDLQARLEEQMEAESAGTAEGDSAADPAAVTETDAAVDAAAEPETTSAPVTQAEVDSAKAAILASLADTIDEINQKIAGGADFDELIATYGVKADGAASDPGMTSEPYKTNGYEVAEGSTNYVPEFVEAAFSVNSVGEVSAPYLSDYGIHIVKYIGDVAEGPIAMTDAQREAKRVALLESKQNELYTAAMEKWIAESTIEYSGLIPTITEIEAQQAAAAEEAAAAESAAAGADAADTGAAEASAEPAADATAEPAAN